MKTASTEREAIVAYLRRHNDGWLKNVIAKAILDVADSIERGEHIKDQDHGRA